MYGRFQVDAAMEAAEGPIYAAAYAHAMARWLQLHGTRNQDNVRLSAEDQATMHRACHERGQEARAANTHTYVRYKSHTSKSATIAMIMPGVGCAFGSFEGSRVATRVSRTPQHSGPATLAPGDINAVHNTPHTIAISPRYLDHRRRSCFKPNAACE